MFYVFTDWFLCHAIHVFDKSHKTAVRLYPCMCVLKDVICMKWQFNLHMIRNIITLLVRIRTKWLVSLEVSVGTKTVAYPTLRRRWLPLAYHVTKTEHHGRLAALWPTLYIEIHIDTFCYPPPSPVTSLFLPKSFIYCNNDPQNFSTVHLIRHL